MNLRRYSLCFFWPCLAACRFLVPWPGIEPTLLTVKARSPNHWTAREFPSGDILKWPNLTLVLSQSGLSTCNMCQGCLDVETFVFGIRYNILLLALLTWPRKMSFYGILFGYSLLHPSTYVWIRSYHRGFPGGAVVENLPANADDTGSSPGLGRSHMPRSN